MPGGIKPRGPDAPAPFIPLNRIPQTLVGETCRYFGEWKSVPEHNTRNPMLLLRLSGLFLLRLAERAFSELLFQEPPRNTPTRYRVARLAKPVPIAYPIRWPKNQHERTFVRSFSGQCS
jgi:hypothetical protein